MYEAGWASCMIELLYTYVPEGVFPSAFWVLLAMAMAVPLSVGYPAAQHVDHFGHFDAVIDDLTGFGC